MGAVTLSQCGAISTWAPAFIRLAVVDPSAVVAVQHGSDLVSEVSHGSFQGFSTSFSLFFFRQVVQRL